MYLEELSVSPKRYCWNIHCQKNSYNKNMFRLKKVLIIRKKINQSIYSPVRCNLKCSVLIFLICVPHKKKYIILHIGKSFVCELLSLSQFWIILCLSYKIPFLLSGLFVTYSTILFSFFVWSFYFSNHPNLVFVLLSFASRILPASRSYDVFFLFTLISYPHA